LAEFDVIVVGAGHNGLTLAAYLAKAGLSVGVFERRSVVGGGLCTEEPLFPGFLHNMHANFHLWPDFAPAWDDLQIEKFGMGYVHPSIPWSAPLSDGRNILIHNQSSLTEKSFSQFSRKDARTFSLLKHDLDRVFKRIVRATIYSVPKEPNPELEKELAKLPWFKKDWFDMDLFEAADDLFENETIKTFILANIWFAGWPPDYQKMGDLVPTFLGLCNHMYLPRGGTFRLAQTLARIVAHHDGRIYANCEVEKIVVNDGKAVGIVLSNPSRLIRDREISARKAIVSATDVTSTFLNLIEDGVLDRSFKDRVKKFDYRGNSLINFHFELNEAPKYRTKDRAIDKGWSQDIGYESYDDLKEDVAAINKGDIPETPRYEAGVNTLFDPSYAPPGKHIAICYREMPNTDKFNGGRPRLESVMEDYADRVLQKWESYAPNMKKENVLARYIYHPYEYERKIVSMRTGSWSLGRMDYEQSGVNRPLRGYADYRTPIRGLYMCSASCHPGGSIFLAAGYNAANVILSDLKMQK
jgi:phytoene dehydrogenase-like protein